MLESDLARSRLDLAIPIWPFSFLSKAEVPLADDSGLVACLFHEVGEGERVIIDNEMPIWWGDSRARFAEGVVPSEERVACRRAGGGGAVAAGEALASGGEFVDVRGFKGGGAVAGEVAVAEIIGHDDDDVRFFSGEADLSETEEEGGDELHYGEFILCAWMSDW